MLTSRSLGMRSATSSPRSMMRPSSGTSNPAIMRSVVVFPHPEGPSSEKTGCRGDVPGTAGLSGHWAAQQSRNRCGHRALPRGCGARSYRRRSADHPPAPQPPVLRLRLTTSAATVPVRAILEYLPYRKDDWTIEMDSIRHPYLALYNHSSWQVMEWTCPSGVSR